MNRIDSFQIQGNARRAGLKIPEMLRDDNPRQIKRTGISLEDKLDSSPEIEHYNNYTKAGVHANNANKDNNTEVNGTKVTQRVVTGSSGTKTVYNYSDDGMLINDMTDAWGTKITNSYSKDGMLIIDMRYQGGVYEIWSTKLHTRYPQDINKEWEIIGVSHRNIETGEVIAYHKRPPDEFRTVLITNGPLDVRYVVEIINVSVDMDGMVIGSQSRTINRAKQAEDEQLRKTEMNRLNELARQTVNDFIDGKIDAAEVSKTIENIYNDLVSLSIALGNTDGNDPQINAEILRSAQSLFSSQALRGTIGANYAEGEAYAKENYGMNPGDRFVYYNAKFYHANKELQEIGKTATSRIANEKGLDFNAQDIHNIRSTIHKPYCFNATWQTTAINSNVSIMKNINLEPPEDFIMFFAPQRFSAEAWNDGTTQIITANDPSRTDGHGGFDFYIKVPKGMTLFKPLPFWMTQGTHTNMDGTTYVAWDITKHIKFNTGDDLQSRLKEFFAEYVNDFNRGTLSVWSNGTKSVHDVPFDIFFDDKRMFHGRELTSAVAHNSFISNFEFHMWSDFRHIDSKDLFKSA